MSKPNTKTPDLTAMTELLNLIKKLRDPKQGCAWTRAQTLESLTTYTLEEAYEIVGAVEDADWENLCGELGDMLYHIVFYAHIAEEKKQFNFADVANTMVKKHEQRRPLETSDDAQLTPEEVNVQWQIQKQKEREAKQKNNQSLLADITLHLPAMTRALKIQQRVAEVGFDWPSSEGALQKLQEETAELTTEIQADVVSEQAVKEELGDLLFTCVNLARHLDVDPEMALRQANQKFMTRFQHIEKHIADTQTRWDDYDLEQLEALWVEAKKNNRG